MTSHVFTELKYEIRQYWRRWSKPAAKALVAFAISILTAFVWIRPEGQKLDGLVLRDFYEFRGPRPAPADVVIVAIDDETYQHLDVSTRWPFPRHFVADALEQIEKASPKAIIIDGRIPKESGVDSDGDDRIEAALRAGPTTIWSGELPASGAGGGPSNNLPSITLSSESRFRGAAKMELPMRVFGSQGAVSSISDSDEPAATLYQRAPIARPLVELAKLEIVPPGPTDLINFYGPGGTLNRLPLYQLLGTGAAAAREELRGKVVFLGYQSLARGRGTMDKDQYNVPVSDDPMFGVEIHANIAGNLIDRSWLKRPSFVTELNVVLLSSLIMASIGIALTPERSVPLIAAMMVAIILIGYRAFAHHEYWISGLGALFATSVATMLGSALYHYVIIDNFRKFIQKAFRVDFKR